MKRFFSILILLAFVNACKKKAPIQQEHNTAIHSEELLHLTDLQVRLANISVDSARMREIGEEILLSSTVSVNQELVRALTAKVMGRIERLYFKSSGEKVRKGQALYQLYSEELALSSTELLLSLDRKKNLNLKEADIDPLISSTKNKLHLYGLTDQQIGEIIKGNKPVNTIDILSPAAGTITEVNTKEGAYIMPGTQILHLAELSSVWVEAQVYPEDLETINSQSLAIVSLASIPGKKYKGRISFSNPELNPSSKINMIRIELDNSLNELVPGMQAYVSLISGKINSMSLPTDAILLDSKGATVWVQSGHNSFKSKMIRTGKTANGFTQVLSGLEPGELVVISGAYLLNSEYLFRHGSSPMEGHNMDEM